MNKPLVRGDLHDPTNERKAKKALSDAAYSSALEFEAAGMKDRAGLTKAQAALERRVDALESRPFDAKATVKLLPPDQPKDVDPLAKLPDPKTALVAATAAEFMRRATGQGTHSEWVLKFVPKGPNHAATVTAANGLLFKSATNPGTTTAAGFGAELVDYGVLPIWFESLNNSVYAALVARGLRLEFGNFNGLTMPQMAADTMAANWVSEGETIPVVSGAVGSLTFWRTKLAAISVYSNELAETSIPHIRRVIEYGLLSAVSMAIDSALLDQSATIPTVRPASILNGKPNQASAGATLALIMDDLKYLLGQADAQKMTDPVLIMHPARKRSLQMIRDGEGFVFRDEIERGELFGLPLIVSNNVPPDVVSIVDADKFAGATEVPQIDVSSSATVVMASDENPAPVYGTGDDSIVGDGDSIHIDDAAAAGAVARSTFQTNCQALRVIAPVSWGMLRSSGAAYLTGVAW
ncbi:phage major capsid protein [Ruegeria atlantica]|uniref:phage major capsid protein n=1 Tax=Ruegeria atlantica TaxID=81569 RepID=UPI00147BF100|nr:phage major capsid protein [Ruegeria atlantica]